MCENINIKTIYVNHVNSAQENPQTWSWTLSPCKWFGKSRKRRFGKSRKRKRRWVAWRETLV